VAAGLNHNEWLHVNDTTIDVHITMLERLLQQCGYISLMPQAVKSSVIKIVNRAPTPK
jgi:hypothetical protein